MTTIVAIRGKKGVYIASDTRVTKYHSNQKIDKRTYLGQYNHKFIRVGYGFYGISGDLELGKWTECLLNRASVYGKDNRDGIEFESFATLPLDASKETIERSVRVFFTSVFSYINNHKILKNNLKGEDISFFYIDKNRFINGDFSTKSGLYHLEIRLFAKDDYYIDGIGSGSIKARKYGYNHFWDDIKGDELLRWAIKSTISHDYGSGGKIITAIIWNKDNNKPYDKLLERNNAYTLDNKTYVNSLNPELVREYFGANIARLRRYRKLIQNLFLNYDLRDHFIAIVNYAKEYYDADIYSILPLNHSARSG